MDTVARQQLRPALAALRAAGEFGEEVAAFLRRDSVQLRFSPQRNSGARWFDWRTLRRGIFVNAEYSQGRLAAPELAALIAHEVVHLRQGVWEALSVRGELVAWQAQRAVLDQIGEPARDLRWRHLQRLDPHSLSDLRQARGLIKGLGGPGYHIELLPLLPVPAGARRLLSRMAGCLSPTARPESADSPEH